MFALVRRVLLVLLVLVVVLVAAGALYVGSRQNLRFTPPALAVSASTDSAVVARGRFVVRDVADCSACHGDPRQATAEADGADVPLSGGKEWAIPPGRFRAPNLTPDARTGLGNVSDAAIAQALRYGIGHDGRALLPFMELQGLSDEDLVAVVSYLRTLAPVEHAVPGHEYNLLGKVVRATVLSQPRGPSGTPPHANPARGTPENGRYLAESVANCWACHTQRDYRTGALVGPRFGGATNYLVESDPSHTWSPPNLTRDPETGRTGLWSEDQFVERFRSGRLVPGSPMPWPRYARLPEEDVRAIYRYLRTLPPVRRDVGPPRVEAAVRR